MGMEIYTYFEMCVHGSNDRLESSVVYDIYNIKKMMMKCVCPYILFFGIYFEDSKKG